MFFNTKYYDIVNYSLLLKCILETKSINLIRSHKS